MRRLAPPQACIGAGEICMRREGVAFLARPSVPLGWHVAFFGTYEPELRRIFRTVLFPGGVAVDVGANIGWHTLLMAQLVGRQGRVLAAEANPSICRKLQQNVELNWMRQVTIVPYALAGCKGTLAFRMPTEDSPDSGNGHIVANDVAPGAEITQVEARLLDEVVAAAGVDRVDLIKIDVEGFEWPVLQGAERTIEKFRPHVVFEFDAAYATRGGGSGPMLADFFRRHRYRLLVARRRSPEPLRSGHWPDCANIWAAPLP